MIRADLLKRELQTKHFCIHYDLRDVAHGRGNGRHGVARRTQVLEYAHALELSFSRLTGPPVNLPPPRVALDGKVHVYLQDVPGGCGFTDAFSTGYPVLALACRGMEPTSEQERHRAYATAAHELAHALTLPRRHSAFVGEPDDPSVSFNLWQWFDEGTAVFAEMHVFPCIHDCMRYLVDWCDEPHRSLDRPGAGYQAGMFVNFMVTRFGHDLLAGAWGAASGYGNPAELLDHIFAPRGLAFASSDPAVPDLFASLYCADAYFLSDPASGCFSPGLLARHGERHVTETLTPSRPDSRDAKGDRVDHLACRYYRLRPTHGGANLAVTLRYEPPASAAQPAAGGCLRAELHQVGPDYRRMGTVVPLTPLSADGTVSTVRLHATFPNFAPRQDLDHLALIVTNCSYGDTALDRVPFSLHATVA